MRVGEGKIESVEGVDREADGLHGSWGCQHCKPHSRVIRGHSFRHFALWLRVQFKEWWGCKKIEESVAQNVQTFRFAVELMILISLWLKDEIISIITGFKVWTSWPPAGSDFDSTWPKCDQNWWKMIWDRFRNRTRSYLELAGWWYDRFTCWQLWCITIRRASRGQLGILGIRVEVPGLVCRSMMVISMTALEQTL